MTTIHLLTQLDLKINEKIKSFENSQWNDSDIGDMEHYLFYITAANEFIVKAIQLLDEATQSDEMKENHSFLEDSIPYVSIEKRIQDAKLNLQHAQECNNYIYNDSDVTELIGEITDLIDEFMESHKSSDDNNLFTPNLSPRY